jgi:hypothetical protein
MPIGPATFGEYLRAFTARWFVFMSGPLSVPAAIAAALVEGTAAKIALATTAIACFGFSSFWIWKIEWDKLCASEAKVKELEGNDVAQTAWGNVRVADNPEAIALFLEHGPQRNKFLALLAQFYITSWARPMAGRSDLLSIDGGIWSQLAVFAFEPKRDDAGTINQTYIRRTTDSVALYYNRQRRSLL